MVAVMNDSLCMLQVHAANKPIDRSNNDQVLHRVAELAVGYSGAALANLLNEAAILAVSKHRCSLMLNGHLFLCHTRHHNCMFRINVAVIHACFVLLHGLKSQGRFCHSAVVTVQLLLFPPVLTICLSIPKYA